MTNGSPSSSSPFSAKSLSRDELEEILRRIDENLELRPLLLAAEQPAAGQIDDEVALAPLPELSDLSGRIHTVRTFNAPYFLVQEGGMRGWLKRLVNLPLRVFGFKQALFNAHALDMLDLLAIQIQALRHRSEQQAAEERRQRQWFRETRQMVDRLIEELEQPGEGIAEKAETNRQRIELLRADLEAHGREVASLAAVRDQATATRTDLDATRTDLNGHSAWIQQVAESQGELARLLHGHTAWIEQVTHTQQMFDERQQGHSKWIQDLADAQQELARQINGHTDWIELVQREAQATALAARWSSAGGKSTDARPEPRIQDRLRYDALVATMPEGLLVNLGCGIRPKEGWINVDFRELPQVDVVADVRVLPFEPGSVAQFEAAHLVEHFRQHEMQQMILPYWRSMLKEGGTLRIVCPNLAAIVARGASGALSMAQVKELMFGGQEYEGNDHFSMYWPTALQQMLIAAGFRASDVLAEERINGICPELEIVARA